MKISKMAEAISYVDEDLIRDAAHVERKKRERRPLLWGGLAACLVAVLAFGTILLPRLLGGNAQFAAAGADKRYKDFTLQVGELGIAWQWEDKTVAEKYVSVDINGEAFAARRQALSERYIGECLGEFLATGYGDVEGGVYHASFEAYEIEGVSPQKLIALKMEGAYYVYLSEHYAPPATWGEVVEDFDLAHTLTLSRFTVKRTGEEDAYRILHDGDYILGELLACGAAPSVTPLGWHETEREYLSFTVTSEPLGIYKQALCVTSDGYVWTNLFYGEHLYFIGVESAQRILSHAMANSDETVFEPYYRTVVGRITQITEDAILIDDAILCRDPADGITYRVPLEDKAIARYVEAGVIGVGDTVEVRYKGTLGENHTVLGVHSIAEAIITAEGVLIPE